MQKGLQSSCLFGSWVACAQAAILIVKPYSINAECGRDINCSLDFGSQVKNSSFRNPNQNRAALWRIFSVQGSMQTVNRTSRRLDSFLHEAAQNFELLSNIQDKKLKIKNI
jgi:hypothetical protein